MKKCFTKSNKDKLSSTSRNKTSLETKQLSKQNNQNRIMLKTLTIIAGITQTTAMSFGEYTKLHNRNYPTSDVSMRKKLYEQRVQVIEAHNSNKDNLYTTAINAFTDRTVSCFVFCLLQPTMNQKI